MKRWTGMEDEDDAVWLDELADGDEVPTGDARVAAAVDRAGVALVGGHTEVTAAVSQPVVVGQMLGFAEDGRVCEHLDHWDSATNFYMRLPIIGSLLSFVRQRISSH